MPLQATTEADESNAEVTSSHQLPGNELGHISSETCLSPKDWTNNSASSSETDTEELAAEKIEIAVYVRQDAEALTQANEQPRLPKDYHNDDASSQTTYTMSMISKDSETSDLALQDGNNSLTITRYVKREDKRRSHSSELSTISEDVQSPPPLRKLLSVARFAPFTTLPSTKIQQHPAPSLATTNGVLNPSHIQTLTDMGYKKKFDKLYLSAQEQATGKAKKGKPIKNIDEEMLKSSAFKTWLEDEHLSEIDTTENDIEEKDLEKANNIKVRTDRRKRVTDMSLSSISESVHESAPPPNSTASALESFGIHNDVAVPVSDGSNKHNDNSINVKRGKHATRNLQLREKRRRLKAGKATAKDLCSKEKSCSDSAPTQSVTNDPQQATDSQLPDDNQPLTGIFYPHVQVPALRAHAVEMGLDGQMSIFSDKFAGVVKSFFQQERDTAERPEAAKKLEDDETVKIDERLKNDENLESIADKKKPFAEDEQLEQTRIEPNTRAESKDMTREETDRIAARRVVREAHEQVRLDKFENEKRRQIAVKAEVERLRLEGKKLRKAVNDKAMEQVAIAAQRKLILDQAVEQSSKDVSKRLKREADVKAIKEANRQKEARHQQSLRDEQVRKELEKKQRQAARAEGLRLKVAQKQQSEEAKAAKQAVRKAKNAAKKVQKHEDECLTHESKQDEYHTDEVVLTDERNQEAALDTKARFSLFGTQPQAYNNHGQLELATIERRTSEAAASVQSTVEREFHRKSYGELLETGSRPEVQALHEVDAEAAAVDSIAAASKRSQKQSNMYDNHMSSLVARLRMSAVSKQIIERAPGKFHGKKHAEMTSQVPPASTVYALSWGYVNQIIPQQLNNTKTTSCKPVTPLRVWTSDEIVSELLPPTRRRAVTHRRTKSSNLGREPVPVPPLRRRNRGTAHFRPPAARNTLLSTQDPKPRLPREEDLETAPILTHEPSTPVIDDLLTRSDFTADFELPHPDAFLLDSSVGNVISEQELRQSASASSIGDGHPRPIGLQGLWGVSVIALLMTLATFMLDYSNSGPPFLSGIPGRSASKEEEDPDLYSLESEKAAVTSISANCEAQAMDETADTKDDLSDQPMLYNCLCCQRCGVDVSADPKDRSSGKIICKGCGPASSIRYCSTICLLADTWSHKDDCRQAPSDLKTDNSLSTVHLPFALLPLSRNLSIEAHQQMVYGMELGHKLVGSRFLAELDNMTKSKREQHDSNLEGQDTSETPDELLPRDYFIFEDRVDKFVDGTKILYTLNVAKHISPEARVFFLRLKNAALFTFSPDIVAVLFAFISQYINSDVYIDTRRRQLVLETFVKQFNLEFYTSLQQEDAHEVGTFFDQMLKVLFDLECAHPGLRAWAPLKDPAEDISKYFWARYLRGENKVGELVWTVEEALICGNFEDEPDVVRRGWGRLKEV